MSEKVVVTDYVFPNIETERAVIEDTEAEFVVANASTPEEVIEASRGATALINNYVPITAEVFDELPDLDVVARYGIGVDGIDVEAATDHGVKVVNVPDYCIDEVSAHAFALILACEREIPQYANHVESGGWDWEVRKPISRFCEKTLGLVAFGKIARAVAEKAEGFGLDVLAYDPHVPVEVMDDHGVERVGFEELLSRSDVVSAHPPLIDETEGLIDDWAFECMQSHATFVNTSRGPVVDEDALYRALVDGEIGRAGIDVMETEPPEDSRLFDLDNCIVTPHVAWYSESSIADLQRTTAEEVARVITGDEPRNLVNPAVQ